MRPAEKEERDEDDEFGGPASRSVVSYASLSLAPRGFRIFSATSRCSCGSHARYTSPNDPSPIRVRSSNGPHVVSAGPAQYARDLRNDMIGANLDDGNTCFQLSCSFNR